MSTTTGLALSAKETPQSVSVITKKQIDDMGLTTMEDALKNTTGINVIRDSGRYRFQSRGFYIDQIEEDGVSSTVPGSSSNPFRTSESMSDLDIYDHIEVLRGASGLTQANGEPGGTINAVRKKPTREFQMHGAVTVGSNNRVRNTVDISGSLNAAKTVRGRLVNVLEKNDSHLNSVDGQRQVLYGVLDIDLGPNTTWTIGGLYQNTKTKPDIFGVPMGTNGKDLGLPTSTYLGADWSQDDFKKYNIFTELTHYLNDDWTLTAKLNAIHNDADQKFAALGNGGGSYTGVGSNGMLAMNNMQYYANSGDQLSFQGNVTGKYTLFGQQHDVFSTVLLSREESESRWRRQLNSTQYNVWTFNPGSIAQPDWDDPKEVWNDVTYDGTIYQRAFSLGTRLNVTDRLHVLVGGRYTNFTAEGGTQYRRWGNRPDNDASRNQSLNKKKFIPYAGLTYDITPQTSVYASYTEIFKPQPYKDVNKNYLEPVVGNNQEVGIKSALLDNKLNLSAAVFQITQENRAIDDPASNASIPEGKVRSRGVDLEASGELQSNWNLAAGYTFNLSKYQKTEGRMYPDGANFSMHTPRHMFRLYSNYRFTGAFEHISIGGGVNMQSETSSLYNRRQGGYALLNANMQYVINKNLKLNFVVQNIADKRYYENQRTRTNGINNFYGTPRTFSLALNWNL